MPGDFNRTVYFLLVCECGSIAKAAEKLYITPQALNRQIRLLEDELGEPLFRRSTRKMDLTPFGLFFRNQMQTVYQLYLSAQQEVANYLNASKPSMNVGFFQGLPKRRIIQPIIEELISGIPDIQIDLVSADLDGIYTDLRNKKTDIAITYVNPIDAISDLATIPLIELECSVVFSTRHPWAKKEFITEEDMASCPVLYLSRSKGPDTEGFYSNLKAASYHFANGSIAMWAQLGLGQHYAVLPTTFENLKETGLLSRPLPKGMKAGFTLSLVYRPDGPYADFFSGLSKLRSTFWKTVSLEEQPSE